MPLDRKDDPPETRRWRASFVFIRYFTYVFLSAFFQPHLVIRRLIIIVMNRLIRTPGGRLIHIIPQVDIHLLPRTHKPRARVRPRKPTNTPLQVIPSKLERPIRILSLRKAHRKRHVIDDARLIHHAVQELLWLLARPGYELHQLAGHDLELARGGVGIEQCGTGGVERRGLHIFVVVGSAHASDPVVAALERGSRAATGGLAATGWGRGRCCCGFRGGYWFWVWDWVGWCGGGTWLALRVIITSIDYK
jgi:hypothetical protein